MLCAQSMPFGVTSYSKYVSNFQHEKPMHTQFVPNSKHEGKSIKNHSNQFLAAAHGVKRSVAEKEEGGGGVGAGTQTDKGYIVVHTCSLCYPALGCIPRV